MGDLDGSGQIDTDDVAAFVLAIADPAAYEQQFGVPTTTYGDIDQDGDVDYDDIAPFQLLIDPAATGAPAQAAESKAVDAVFEQWAR